MVEKAVDSCLQELRESDLQRTSEGFKGQILTGLTGALQECLGTEESRSFFNMVGDEISRSWDAEYKEILDTPRLSREQVAASLVDLKERIGGQFEVVECTNERITLCNRMCPFGDAVKGRPSMCELTRTVFGRITANNLGYAGVCLKETIADGSNQCKVVINLNPGAKTVLSDDHEFFGDPG